LKFVDAHIHLSDHEYADKIEMLLKDAEKSNVIALVSNSMDLQTSISSLKLSEKYPKRVYAALGIHPWTISQLSLDERQLTIELIQKQRNNKNFVAIGEIGLDVKNLKEKELNKLQLEVFQEMLSLAEKFDLPVIIHSRGTTTKVMEILPSFKLDRVLLHWFSYPKILLPTIIERGYYITEGPPAIYSQGIRKIIETIPLENFLTETDGPVRFFREPFSGKITLPSFIPLVVEAVAELKKMEVAEVADQILENFVNFFRIELL
jgi:TatD DNase family protein